MLWSGEDIPDFALKMDGDQMCRTGFSVPVVCRVECHIQLLKIEFHKSLDNILSH